MAAAALVGCASTGPASVLADGPRMIDLYRGTSAAGPETAEDGFPEAATPRCRWWLFTWPCHRVEPETRAPGPSAPTGEAASYARTAANELELLFPRLPNPDIYIHVLPHLATEARVPVPGYTTAVPLYERVEYALPGELERAMRRLEPGLDAAVADAAGSSTGAGNDAAPPVPEGGDPP